MSEAELGSVSGLRFGGEGLVGLDIVEGVDGAVSSHSLTTEDFGLGMSWGEESGFEMI